ncbi:putative voltage-gated potassium channel subunit beta [Mollisia scopiformis]|uniref:Putative voltage-gated potassium channel subunit beta n=1 Tax=Mollisia scopiformis TaxID=149040 RepID=A0A194X4A3_MOLSC|nr:putative voltage-gated potassium channel subunit beta [Mollisia scopiformis]KUJ15008.1 putative voltage-gated potassium channel subunit beta [Mollisia scopiformis]
MPDQGFPQTGKRFEPKNMLFRYLGDTGLKVSVLGLGGWLTYGSDNGVKEVEQTAECLQEAWDHGINFFDTAEVYAEGQSEIIMGKALKKCGFERDDYVITTKLHFGDGNGYPNNHGLSRKHIIEGMKRSLKRLELDSVDVVYAHRADFWCTPMEETVRAFNTLIEHGHAHYWGTSEWSAFEIEHAQHVATRLGLIGPVVEQPQYNMFVRERFEAEYSPLYKLYNYGTTIWSPLYQGILTGKYNDGVPADSRYATISKDQVSKFEQPETKAQIEKVKKLTTIAEKLGGSVGNLALAWVIKNPHVSVAILGATKASQITENVKCLELFPKMTDEVMKEIDEVLDNTPKMPGPIPPTRGKMTLNKALM